MNQWNNEELRPRQQNNEVGFFRAYPSHVGGRAKLLRAPGAVVLTGVMLMLVNVLPGLGVFLVLGGVMGLLVVVVTAWLGG